MAIVWKQEMSVGNAIIDDEHKQLICLINSVEIALKADNHMSMIQFLVDQLEEYTHTHFVQEEKMMLQLKYGGYADHKIEHQKILEKIAALKNRLAVIAEQESNFDVNTLRVSASNDDDLEASEAETEAMTEAPPAAEQQSWINKAEIKPGEEPAMSTEEQVSESQKEKSYATDFEHPKDTVGAIEQDIASILRTWIIDHVFKVDMKLKPLFNQPKH